MRVLVAVLLAAAPTVAAPRAMAAPRTYELPAETAQLAPGPGQELAMGNCGACHSAEYVATQPRGLPNARAFWQAEVVKMKAAYGAPIADGDVAALVDYLVAAYGK